MKTKYESKNKNEKHTIYNRFKEDKKELYKKLIRMLILCYIGIGYSLIIFIYDLFFKKGEFNYILDIIIFIFCLIYLIKVINVKKDLLNDYILKK